MNQLIRDLAESARIITEHGQSRYALSEEFEQKFAQLIVRECARRNRQLSYELAGVIEDVQYGPGFDSVCLETVRRVEQALYDKNLLEYLESTDWATAKKDLGFT